MKTKLKKGDVCYDVVNDVILVITFIDGVVWVGCVLYDALLIECIENLIKIGEL